MTARAVKTSPADYAYSFPKELIAARPATPRDSSRLLAYDRAANRVTEGHFRDLPDLLPPGSVLVLNETKVIPARLTLTKEDTGGQVRVLLLSRDRRALSVMADRRLHAGQLLRLTPLYRFRVLEYEQGTARLEPLFDRRRLARVLDTYGAAPLPPYIKNPGLSPAALRRRYQSVFAKRRGSVAAPTASLHFTPRLFARLKKKGIKVVKLTLHVGLGTFAPLTEKQLRTGRLHEESFIIPAATARAVNAARRTGRPIIPVGTTALRALESAADRHGVVCAQRGQTSLFVRDGYRFRVAAGLITNFHVPESSLMMLVAALVTRPRLLALYRLAIAHRYRLFSFGDAMLIT